MAFTFRALLTGLIGLTISLTASGCQGHARQATGQQLQLDVSQNDPVEQLLDPGKSDASLVKMAVSHLEDGFYKPIDPQTPFTGESALLKAYLAKHGVAHATLPHETATGDESSDAAKMTDVLDYAQAHYGKSLGASAKSTLTEVALSGILSSVKDPYTVYLPPRENQSLTESLSGGNFGGIGVYIVMARDGSVVVMPIEGMPAAHSGMKPGEVVDSVDGTVMKGVDLDHAMQMIRGDAGTTVRLATHAYPMTANAPRGPEHHYSIVRQIIHVPTVHAKMEGHYDYIRLSDFGETSADEIHKALLDGKRHGATGYILDLRDNGGGFVDAAVKISSYFIPQGETIVSTISRAGVQTTEEANGDQIAGLKPLVILVNGYTASASEITAGALQDYHLATLIGTKTFGKGVVQNIYPMPDDGALKITTARYVTPLGRDIQHKGIEPDIVVTQSSDPTLIDTKADVQLAAAKARLQQLAR
jgi:carboxyl-terminal processing protease